jgi:uncharacterized protein (TIGR02284 family)
MTTNNTLDTVEKLIQTCRDGEEGYRSAAEHTKDAELRSFFNRQSMERARFTGELQTAARTLGEPSPSQDASMASKLHRAWFDLKQKLGGGEVSVLESVETGEEAARQEYQEALSADLPYNVRSIVERQSESISVACDRVSALLDQFKRAA